MEWRVSALPHECMTAVPQTSRLLPPCLIQQVSEVSWAMSAFGVLRRTIPSKLPTPSEHVEANRVEIQPHQAGMKMLWSIPAVVVSQIRPGRWGHFFVMFVSLDKIGSGRAPLMCRGTYKTARCLPSPFFSPHTILHYNFFPRSFSFLFLFPFPFPFSFFLFPSNDSPLHESPPISIFNFERRSKLIQFPNTS